MKKIILLIAFLIVFSSVAFAGNETIYLSTKQGAYVNGSLDDRTARGIIWQGAINGTATSIRLKYVTGADSLTIVLYTYIAEMNGSILKVKTDTMKNITFNGSNTFAIGNNNAYIWSDWINYNLDNTKNYSVTLIYGGSYQSSLRGVTNSTMGGTINSVYSTSVDQTFLPKPDWTALSYTTNSVDYIPVNEIEGVMTLTSVQLSILNHAINFTSDGGKACGYNTSSQYTDCGPTEDGTPTINFHTNNSMSCKLWNESKSWSALNNMSVPDCSTTGDTNHICTFPFALLNGTQTLYISCKAGTVEYYNITYYPANMFNITIQAPIRLYQSTADDAIMYGISKSSIWPSATIFTKQPVYIRNKINNQSFATFDKVAVYGNQRWAFSYITWDDNYTIGKNFFNISPIFYFWEGVNLTYLDVTNQVTALINSTKN